jgi:[FeFe] hydrogenase H-cluster maturation GTPase HydF
MSSSIQSSVSSGNRTHIGLFGRMNAGKSSLINAFTGQQAAIVSEEAGTTTDVVKKPMEIHGIGACLLLDTAGFDDQGKLGQARVQAAEKAAAETDLAIVLFYEEEDHLERRWVETFRKRKTPVVGVLSRADEFSREAVEERTAKLEKELSIPVIAVSTVSGTGLKDLRLAMIASLKGENRKKHVTAGLVHPGDLVMLVMPQDPQAPEGRLIQPEVMTIRDCLDEECVTVCVTLDGMKTALANLKKMPDLIITDSQAFQEVNALKPEESRLTSFSVLMAGLKGDIRYYAESAAAIDVLNENSRVLIAECCTHAPMEEDIGRVKIPRLLRKKAGEGLHIDVQAGTDFPSDASAYDLIIQCGGCMFNRRYVMSRIEAARKAGVPMTNYGIAIAYLNGILEHVVLPEE